MKKRILSAALLLMMVLSIAACGAKETQGQDEVKEGEEITSVKLGTMASETARFEIVKEILAEKGIDAEVIMYDGNAGPATALQNGEVDAIMVNHLQWVNAYNEANNANLVMVEPYAYWCPVRMFSTKWDKIEDIPDGATIALSNDPSNLEVALTMLDSCGFIKLSDEKAGDYYSEVDIVENTKNINLSLSDTVYVAQSADSADAIVSFTFFATEAGFDPTDYLYENPSDKDNYPCGLIVNDGDQDKEWVKYLAETMVEDEWVDKFIEAYGEGICGYYDR